MGSCKLQKLQGASGKGRNDGAWWGNLLRLGEGLRPNTTDQSGGALKRSEEHLTSDADINRQQPSVGPTVCVCV